MKEDMFCIFILFLEWGIMFGLVCCFGKEKLIVEKYKKYLIFLIIIILLGEGGGVLVVLFRLFFLVFLV